MYGINDWLFVSMIGIFFGLFPLWISSLGNVIYAIFELHKKVSPRLLKCLGQNSDPSLWKKGTLSNRKQYILDWIISIIYVVIIFGGYQYLALPDLRQGDLRTILIIETSLPLFLLLTWLLPVYFLRRYLNKLPVEKDEEDDSDLDSK